MLSQRRGRILARLRDRKARVREGLVLVEGIRAAAEALDGGARVRFAVVSPRLEELPGGLELRRRLAEAGVSLDFVTDRDLAAAADTRTAQGVLLACEEPSAEARLIRRGGRYLALDAVQDPGNVGTLVRAAVAFGLDGVIALDGTADPWGAKAVRASAGLVFRQALTTLDGEAALDRFEEAGVPVLASDPRGTDVAEVEGRGGWALVVGNEGAGVRPLVLERATAVVRVPMPGPAESLNVAAAGAVMLYALTRENIRA